MFALQFEQLDRQAELRPKVAELRELAAHSNSFIIPVHKQQLLTLDSQLHWLNWQQLLEKFHHIEDKHLIYLGKIQHNHYYSYRVSNTDQFRQAKLSWQGLRQLLPYLNEQQAYLANVASAIEHWHNTHQYCGYCGHPTFAKQAGHVRQCSNAGCAREHFPRTDAAVICAIRYQDKLLLGRQAEWPEHRYSVIAGFVEPGESLEQAVAREALEEVGLSLTDIRYFGSQPWPFPQSLMTGFTAEATHPHIQLKDQELEDAAWFSRQQIEQMTAEGSLILPFKYSISRALVEDWRKQ